MEFELIQDLTESKMFRSKSNIAKYNAKDIADITFLYFLALEILSQEYSSTPFTITYAKKTIMFNDFSKLRYTGTDLSVMLHILSRIDPSIHSYLSGGAADKVLLSQIQLPPLQTLKRYFQYMAKGTRNRSFSSRLLLQLQRYLSIDTSNYRSIRVLAIDWDKITEDQKRLAMTRLLQAFRIRARRSELLPYLENLAKTRKLELHDVSNAEVKQGSTTSKPGSFLKTAIAAALAGGAGFYAGYRMTRNPNLKKGVLGE